MSTLGSDLSNTGTEIDIADAVGTASAIDTSIHSRLYRSGTYRPGGGSWVIPYSIPSLKVRASASFELLRKRVPGFPETVVVIPTEAIIQRSERLRGRRAE